MLLILELKKAFLPIIQSFESFEMKNSSILLQLLNAKFPMISIKSGNVTWTTLRGQKTRTSKFCCSLFDLPRMNLSSYILKYELFGLILILFNFLVHLHQPSSTSINLDGNVIALIDVCENANFLIIRSLDSFEIIIFLSWKQPSKANGSIISIKSGNVTWTTLRGQNFVVLCLIYQEWICHHIF